MADEDGAPAPASEPASARAPSRDLPDPRVRPARWRGRCAGPRRCARTPRRSSPQLAARGRPVAAIEAPRHGDLGRRVDRKRARQAATTGACFPFRSRPPTASAVEGVSRPGGASRRRPGSGPARPPARRRAAVFAPRRPGAPRRQASTTTSPVAHADPRLQRDAPLRAPRARIQPDQPRAHVDTPRARPAGRRPHRSSGTPNTATTASPMNLSTPTAVLARPRRASGRSSDAITPAEHLRVKMFSQRCRSHHITEHRSDDLPHLAMWLQLRGQWRGACHAKPGFVGILVPALPASDHGTSLRRPCRLRYAACRHTTWQ